MAGGDHGLGDVRPADRAAAGPFEDLVPRQVVAQLLEALEDGVRAQQALLAELLQREAELRVVVVDEVAEDVHLDGAVVGRQLDARE